MKVFKFYAPEGVEQKDYSTLGKDEITAELDKLDAEEPEVTPEGQVTEDNPPEPKEEPAAAPESTEKPKETAEPKKPEEQPEKVAEPPEITPEKDKVEESDKGLVFTEEMFNKLPEDKQKQFAKFKGKSLDDILDSYGNLETFVGKKQGELKKELFTPKEPEKPKTPEALEESRKVKEQLIVTDLRRMFPDLEFPENLDENSPEFKEWLSDLNISDRPTARRFEKALDDVSSTVEKDLKEIEHFRSHYVEINNGILENSISGFNDYYSKELGTNLKDFGIDLNQKDGNGELVIVNAVLNDESAPENNFLDPNIVKFGKKGTPYEGIPFIDQKAFDRKFFQLYNKQIFDKAIEKARLDAVTKKGNGSEPLPSMSGSAVKGEQKKELTLEDYTKISDPKTINEELDRLEQM